MFGPFGPVLQVPDWFISVSPSRDLDLAKFCPHTKSARMNIRLSDAILRSSLDEFYVLPYVMEDSLYWLLMTLHYYLALFVLILEKQISVRGI